MARSAVWLERDLEDWLLKNKVLLGEKLLFLQQHRAIRRMVDLAALDSLQRLTLLEIKNERATRTSLGQAMEYLAVAEGTTLKELADDYRQDHDRDLAADYGDRFEVGLSLLNPARRVFIIGPDFEPEAYAAAEYLSRNLQGAEVVLVKAICRGVEFEFERYVPPPTRKASQLARHAIAEGRKGRLYAVLQHEPLVLWRIGRLMDTGTVALLSTAALQRSLSTQDVDVHNISAPISTDFELFDSVWERRHGLRTVQARVLGCVESRLRRGRQSAWNLIYARFDGGLVKLRKAKKGDFVRRWKRNDNLVVMTWKEIADRIATF